MGDQICFASGPSPDHRLFGHYFDRDGLEGTVRPFGNGNPHFVTDLHIANRNRLAFLHNGSGGRSRHDFGIDGEAGVTLRSHLAVDRLSISNDSRFGSDRGRWIRAQGQQCAWSQCTHGAQTQLDELVDGFHEK